MFLTSIILLTVIRRVPLVNKKCLPFGSTRIRSWYFIWVDDTQALDFVCYFVDNCLFFFSCSEITAFYYPIGIFKFFLILNHTLHVQCIPLINWQGSCAFDFYSMSFDLVSSNTYFLICRDTWYLSIRNVYSQSVNYIYFFFTTNCFIYRDCCMFI